MHPYRRRKAKAPPRGGAASCPGGSGPVREPTPGALTGCPASAGSRITAGVRSSADGRFAVQAAHRKRLYRSRRPARSSARSQACQRGSARCAPWYGRTHRRILVVVVPRSRSHTHAMCRSRGAPGARVWASRLIVEQDCSALRTIRYRQARMRMREPMRHTVLGDHAAIATTSQVPWSRSA